MAPTLRRIWRVGFGHQAVQTNIQEDEHEKERGIDVMMEMGDVFSYLFQLAHMLNVDLDAMWIAHGQKMQHKNIYHINIQ